MRTSSTPRLLVSASTTSSTGGRAKQIQTFLIKQLIQAPGHRPGAFAAPVDQALERAAASAIVESVAASLGKSAATQAASAAASAAPSAGPLATPRAIKSAALSGNVGGIHRRGNVKARRQAGSVALDCARD